LPAERLIVRKDGEGNVLDPRIATALLQAFAGDASPRRLTIQIRTQPDYDPFAMGADDELAALIGARHAEAFRQLRERIPPHLGERSLTIVKELLPLPLAIVEADVDGLTWLIDEAEAQVLYQDIAMRPFLNQTSPQIQAGTAHSAGATGSGQTVAVLDTGVQRSHPMFSGKIVGEVCYASNKPGYAGCPTGHTRAVPASGAAETCTVFPDCDHGTHVAAIAIGSQQTVPPSGPVIKGIGYAGNLMPVITGSLTNDNDDCGGFPPCVRFLLSDTTDALDHVYSVRATLNIASVNLSYGEPNGFSGYCDIAYADMAQSVDLLTGAGVAVVAASGNQGDFLRPNTTAAPACIENTIAVGATDKSNNHAYYSNASPALDLLAPGGLQNFTTNDCTTPHQCVLSAIPGSTYGSTLGTSMASPHVAGAIAALRNLWPKAGVSVATIVDHLKNTGLAVSFTQGPSSTPYTRSLIQLGDAVAQPTKPATASVERMLCYGSNMVAWSASSGPFSHYELQGSYSSGYAAPFVLYSGTSTATTINVSGTTWIRVRACHGPSCSTWENGDITATYTPGCI
jgi:subtilisin family serine protease